MSTSSIVLVRDHHGGNLLLAVAPTTSHQHSGSTVEFTFCLQPVLHVVSVFAATRKVKVVGATGNVAVR